MLKARSRRRIGAYAVMAILAAAGVTVVAPTAHAQPPTQWFHYENGTRAGLNECCGYSIVVDDLARTGAYAVRSHVRFGDPMVAGGVRAESHTLGMPETYYQPGDVVYYGFSIYILSTWQRDSREDLVFQWKPWRDACEADKPPSAFLLVQPSGTWRLRVNSDSNACSTSGSIHKTSFDIAPVKPGQWHDFVFRFQWGYGNDGTIDAWHQTHKSPGWQSVLSTTGPNTFNDDPTTSGYLKWGLYKPAWNTAPTDVTSRTIFHDNVAIGSSFTAVDPTTRYATRLATRCVRGGSEPGSGHGR